MVQAWVDGQYSKPEAKKQIREKFPSFGTSPHSLRLGTSVIAINKDQTGLNAGSRVITVHQANFKGDNRDGFSEEAWIHENAHLAYDYWVYEEKLWKEAVTRDKKYISDYAKNNPDSEEVAESFGAWWAYDSRRLQQDDVEKIAERIPARLGFFHDLNF